MGGKYLVDFEEIQR